MHRPSDSMRFSNDRFSNGPRALNRRALNPRAWNRRALRLLIALAGCIVMMCCSSNVFAQVGFGGIETSSTRPSQDYYNALEIYRSGDLPTAARGFDIALGQTQKDINGRWIDSIPVYAMLAECSWHQGDMATTHQYLDAAYQIAIRYRGWLGRPDWSTVLQAGAVTSRPSGLWPDATAVNPLPITQRLQFASGERATEAALLTPRAGGFESLNIKVMDVVELMRGLAIVSYRRRMLLGPLAEQDPLTGELLDATKYPAGLQIPIARALIGSMRAAERFANHDDKQCVADSIQSAVVNNGVHPLTPISLLCQASVIAGSDKPVAAVPIAMNAANVAASLGQYEYVGEALQLAAGCADPQQAGTIRNFGGIAATSLLRKSRLAAMHCMIAGADAAVTAEDLNTAEQMLAQAQAMAARRDVMQPRLNAYGAYVAARLAAARGASIGIGPASEVDKAIGLLSEFALNRKNRNRPLVSMPRIYQLQLVGLSIGKSLGGESSDRLLEAYCHEPPVELWRRDPVDALSSMMIDRTVPYVARLEIAAAGNQGSDVLSRMDDLLRHRFGRRLALGGRVTQVRSLVRGDDKQIGKEAADFRNNAPAGIKALRQAVLAPQAAGIDDVIKAANQMESMATQIALSRTELPLTMLPPLQEKTAISRIPDGTGLLTFVNIDNRLYATLAAEGNVQFWKVGGVGRIPSEIGRLLKTIGVGKTRGNRLPEDDGWRKDAVSLRRHLFPDDTTITAARFKHLVIVPDSSLWYLPFELLPLADESSDLMGDQISIRYAATPGLAFQPTGPPATSRVVAIASDKFFAPRDVDLNESITTMLADSVPESVRLPQGMNVPTGLLTDKVGHLLVAAPTVPNANGPFATSVASYDRSLPEGTLAGWMRFPAKVPESVVLPGYRTGADAAKLADGEELFLTICALQSSGVRNVLISRWIVGGQSTAIALGELMPELPFSGMQASWARARAMLRRSGLDPTAEPMLTKAEHEIVSLTGDSPFFWAGYLVAAPMSESELNPPGTSMQPNK
ncbi:MAG: CHAT domain-containing protein [Pirellulaceae bacterium]